MPERITYQRGEYKPEGSIVVSGASKWATPHSADELGSEEAARRYRDDLLAGRLATRSGRRLTIDLARRELGGADLACTCPAGAACHADVLLQVANA